MAAARMGANVINSISFTPLNLNVINFTRNPPKSPFQGGLPGLSSA